MAATFQVSAPEPFNFSCPAEWTKWRRRFERFRKASGLDASDEEAQVNTLIYAMGDQADDILRSFGLSEEDAKKYKPVVDKFEAHFVKKRNVIYERARFNMRRQEEGEPVDSFITSLYTLAEHCGYGALHDEMVRDRIVVGISNAQLSEKLQLKADLTLETAIQAVRQAETVRQQQPLLRAQPGALVGALRTWRTTEPYKGSGPQNSGGTRAKQAGRPTLTPSDRTLRGPDTHVLPVIGRFTAALKRGSQETHEEVYVVEGLNKPLLGRPAIEGLGLLARVSAVTESSLVEQFPRLFQGLGKMKGDYTIRLKDGAKPFALSTPRRVAIPLLKPVQLELERMEKLGVITKVEEPTEWCSGMVVAPKANGRVRICVDLTRLNQSVCRERHLMPAVDQILAQLAGAKVFTKLDANSGFWQIPLSPESFLLTTFITPFGRFCFQRLPFGITSAPEHFQRRMSEILSGVSGVVCMVDDVLVHGQTKQEHDDRLREVLQRLQDAGVTLNAEKCVFAQNKVKFLGHVIDETGIKPDPDKVFAIQKVPPPGNVGDVRRFLGMANQMSKFAPNLADITQPLRELLVKGNQWVWGEPQRCAFERIKEVLISSPVLALFDANLETILSADASSHGLGAVLLQKQKCGDLKPVAYISRSMNPTEGRYAQIEKEALAFTWACERLSDYLIGLKFHIHTDHKPLVPLFSSKHLDELPVRVQRFRLRMMRFDFTISHVPGKDLLIADALSRAPVASPTPADQLLQQEADAYVRVVVQNVPATEPRLIRIKQLQDEDEACQKIIEYSQTAWPDKRSVDAAVLPYYSVAAEFAMVEGLLMRGSRIVIPPPLRQEMLAKIHTGHQGIVKCRERARQSMWWPGLSKELEELVRNCPECSKAQKQRAQPSALPKLPWQKVGTDLFEWRQRISLLLTYSRYVEIA